MSKRTLLFLYGTPNLVGCVLGLIGLVYFFLPFIFPQVFGKSGLLELFIIFGLYGVGYLLSPNTRSQVEIHKALERELSVKEFEKLLNSLVKKIRRRVQKPVLQKVISIKENVVTLLPHLEEMNKGQYDLHVVKQTVTEYLPEMLATYLELPPAFARMHKVRGGKTSQQILIEQLEILDKQITQIVVDINSKDAEALIAHGRFLKDKFANSDDWL